MFCLKSFFDMIFNAPKLYNTSNLKDDLMH